MENRANLPVLPFETQPDWEAWLEQNHADSAGVWLKLAKKDSGIATVTYAQALDAALCYGWIDGQKAPFDDRFWLQKFTRRGPRSGWSKINTEKAEALIAAGRMRPPGLRQVELAQADGRWERAYNSASKIAVPADLALEFELNPAAREFFDTLDSANRYAVLYRIETAKKAETRAARIEKFIAMLARREKIYP